MNEILENDISIRNNTFIISSRILAKRLNKEHSRVLRDIRDKSLGEFAEWIIPAKYTSENGQEYDELLFTKDGVGA